MAGPDAAMRSVSGRPGGKPREYQTRRISGMGPQAPLLLASSTNRRDDASIVIVSSAPPSGAKEGYYYSNSTGTISSHGHSRRRTRIRILWPPATYATVSNAIL